MEATSDNPRQDFGEGRTKKVSINIYYSSLPYSKDEPKIRQHDMLFGFGKIQNDVEKKIKNWIKTYEETYPAFDLYFSAKTGEQPYLDEKFLTLVRGLEAYIIKENLMKGLYLWTRELRCIIEPFKEIIGDRDKRNNLI